MNNSNLRDYYLKNGYIILKSVFSKEYISKIRNKIISSLLNSEKYTSRNSAKYISKFETTLDEDIQNILLNERLINSIKEILATKSLLYYADSNIVVRNNPNEVYDKYHHDARGEDINISNEEEYPIIRLGVYFHDTKNFSGGLKIRKKSHKHIHFKFNFWDYLRKIKLLCLKKIYSFKSLRLGKGLNIELEEGDIVIWNLRTHHAGMSRRLKMFPKLCLWPLFDKLIPNYFFLPFQYSNERVALFCSFAKNDMNNKNILGYLKHKTSAEKINQIKSNSNLLNKLNSLECYMPKVELDNTETFK